jgi:hypothetical protein
MKEIYDVDPLAHKIYPSSGVEKMTILNKNYTMQTAIQPYFV